MTDQVETTDIVTRPYQQPALAPQSLTPAQMLSIAVQQDAPVEKIEKLMDLQQRWEQNEARKAFEVAMVSFSAKVPTISKTRKGHTNMYAGLPETVEEIQVLMSECQLSRRWKDEEPKKKPTNIRIRCIVSHILGHSESFAEEAGPDTGPGRNDIQAVASTITYLRRITLFAVLGLVAGDEVDDDGAGGKKTEPPKPKAQELADEAKAKAQGKLTPKQTFVDVCRRKANAPELPLTVCKAAYEAVTKMVGTDDVALCLECVQRADVEVHADGTVQIVDENAFDEQKE